VPSRESLVARIAGHYGTPCYVYFVEEIDRRIRSLGEAFGGLVELSYAVKANPHVALLSHLRGRVAHLDVSSGGEVERALSAGWPAGSLSFTGPGKRPWELDYAVTSGVGLIVIESVRELTMVNRIAQRAGARQRIAIRIGPRVVPRGFGVSMAGRPSQFGIDEELLAEVVAAMNTCSALTLCGFHVYAGTQCLSPDTLVENFEVMVRVFRDAAELFDVAPDCLVFGAGFGIPYYPDSVPLELGPVASRISPLLTSLRSGRFAHSHFLLELGRFLVGEAGVFAMSVLDVKDSRGRKIAVCDGGMHQHLGAAGHLGTIVPRNYRMFRAPTSASAPASVDRASPETYDVVGPLCTSIDTLGRGVTFDALQVGDVIGIECSGAYGFSVSPMSFISHPPPLEVFVWESGDEGARSQLVPDMKPTFPGREGRSTDDQ
jgi:diaminopimelate decarboxylase